MDAELRKLQGLPGGLEKVATGTGIIGFIRFLQGYYLILITSHKEVGKIGHHAVQRVAATSLVALCVESAKGLRGRSTSGTSSTA